MGFSSGKSSAKRKAEQAQHDAYLKALKGVERLDDVSNQATNNYRTVRDKVGDNNLDGYSKALLRKADSMGRDINQNSGEVNAAIGQYNNRYDKLQKQLNGESIHDGYDVKIKDPNMARMGLMGVAMQNSTKSFDTKEEAENYEYQPKPNPIYNNPLTGKPQQNGNPNYLGFGQERQEQPVQKTIVERRQTPINWYRGTLRASSDAYNDISKLADNVNQKSEQAGLEQYKSEYEMLQKRLQNSLRRSQGVVKPVNTGLIGEVITNNQSPIDAIRQAG